MPAQISEAVHHFSNTELGLTLSCLHVKILNDEYQIQSKFICLAVVQPFFDVSILLLHLINHLAFRPIF